MSPKRGSVRHPTALNRDVSMDMEVAPKSDVLLDSDLPRFKLGKNALRPDRGILKSGLQFPGRSYQRPDSCTISDVDRAWCLGRELVEYTEGDKALEREMMGEDLVDPSRYSCTELLKALDPVLGS